jgi:hypothetical protein
MNLIVRFLKDTFQYYHPVFPRVFQKAHLLLLEVVCAEPTPKLSFLQYMLHLRVSVQQYRSWSSSQSSFRLSPTLSTQMASLQLVATEVLFRRHFCCRLQISSALKITAAGLSGTLLISGSVECIESNIWAGMVQQLATGWTARGSNPGGGAIFRICPPSLLYKRYRVSFPG